jgi:hypothetical protein
VATVEDSRTAGQRRRPNLGLGLLLVLVVSFAAFSASRMLPAQPYGLAVDWRVFSAAATVVGQGGSPYDPAVLAAAEQRADHYPVAQPVIDDFANPALVAWILQPLAALPFWLGYAVLAALGLVAAALALTLWLRRLGWRQPVRWSLLALLSWPSLVGLFSGQFDLLLLAMAIGAMVLAIRRRPGLAGSLCVVAAMFKPHILWPLPILLAAAQVPDRRAVLRCAGAAVATTAVVAAAGELLMPGSTRAFLAHLMGFGSRVSTAQPDLAGVSGLLARLPWGGVAAVAIAVAGAAATMGFAGWWAAARRPRSLPAEQHVMLGVSLGLALWLVAAPYAHPNDDVLLFPLLAMVIGSGASAATPRQLAWALVAAFGVVAAFLLSPAAGLVAVVAAAAAAWLRRDVIGDGWAAAASLAGLVVLPMAWPFHLLAVSLTPLAVLTVAAAGVLLVRRSPTLRAGCSRACAPAS